MPADLLSARFAALELGVVAAEAPRLAREVLDGLLAQSNMAPGDGGVANERQEVAATVLQAATACLSAEGQGSRSALRGAVAEWLSDLGKRDAFNSHFQIALQQSPQSWPAKLMTALVLSLAGKSYLRDLGEPFAASVREMARTSHSPFGWRALRMLGPLTEGAEVKGIALAYLAPEILPVLSANLKDSGSGPVVEAFQAILQGREVSISDHNRLDTALFRDDVTVRGVLPVLSQLPATMPGRLPEFHGAFRVLFGGGGMTPMLARGAVGAMAQFVPWWPKELRAEAFVETPFSPTLISSLIDTADRCGRLPDLAAALARGAYAPEACHRLAALIEATVAHYRAAAFPG